MKQGITLITAGNVVQWCIRVNMRNALAAVNWRTVISTALSAVKELIKMDTAIKLNSLLIGEIYRLNKKFVHEIWQYINEDNFPEFVKCFDCIMNKKWLEYSNLN